MAPTVKDILKQTGITDEAIAAMDANAMKAFETVLSTAAAAQEQAAELERRQRDLYDSQIAPALNQWGSEKATLEAERDFYKKQNEGARAGGFVPKDAPTHTAPPVQDPGTGRFVAGANAVPGSPGFTAAEGLEAISNATWYGQEHQRLFGQPAPDDFMSLVREATDNRYKFRDYVEKKYKFAEKRTEIAALKQKEHDDKIRKEATEAADKVWAEKVGNNPMVRQGVPSQYEKIQAGVKSGALKDPLTLSAEARRTQTRQNIAADMASQGTA
jgi:hypothetical protein